MSMTSIKFVHFEQNENLQCSLDPLPPLLNSTVTDLQYHKWPNKWLVHLFDFMGPSEGV